MLSIFKSLYWLIGINRLRVILNGFWLNLPGVGESGGFDNPFARNATGSVLDTPQTLHVSDRSVVWLEGNYLIK